ncbi:MAG TPA: hypothetical protein VLR70_01255 [Arthrobacter sp.]|nr:hypothetical protein [Arthrobacter sp.]
MKLSTETQSTPKIRLYISLVLAILVAITVPVAEPRAVAAEAPQFPVSGFFVRASPSDAVNTQKLSDIRGAGGDTVITFGSHLMPASLGSVSPDCRIGTANCVQAAAAGVRLNRVFAYTDASPWGAAAVTCPRDRTITSNNKLFTLLVLPTQGAGCDSPNGAYDIVVISGGRPGTGGATESMARAATAQGMQFFAGMPIPAKRADLPYLPDLSYQNTFSLFTNRYLRYHATNNDVPGLAGFYLSTEMPLSSAAIFEAVLAVYRIQNQAIRAIMPARSAVVSPYIDARSAAAGSTTPAEAQVAVRNIALTAAGVHLSIAVQDGMGTGKGGAFFGNEASAPVDQPAAAIVGAGSWGSRYLAPNRDYFVAAAHGVAGTGATLWANMEGMAPATGANACDANLRGQTTNARLDRQLQQMANAPKKIISFMWDTYNTCAGTGVPLVQQVLAGKATPLITDSVFDPASGALTVTGYNLSGVTVELKWTAATGQAQGKTVPASAFNPAYGRQNGLNPALQAFTAHVGGTTLNPGTYYMVNITNAWGARNDAFYSKRG